MSTSNLRVERRRESGRIRLLVDGALDLAGAATLDQALDAALADAPVILDLRSVPFIDSSGLALLLDRTEQARREGGELRIVPSPDVRTLLSLAQVEDELQLGDA